MILKNEKTIKAYLESVNTLEDRIRKLEWESQLIPKVS